MTDVMSGLLHFVRQPPACIPKISSLIPNGDRMIHALMLSHDLKKRETDMNSAKKAGIAPFQNMKFFYF